MDDEQVFSLVKVAALLKDMLVAKTFGTGDAMDALLIAFLIPSFVINVFAGAIGNSLIPTYIQVRDNEGKTEAHELVSGTLVLALGLLVGMTLMFVLIGPYILPFLCTGFNEQKMALTQELFLWFLPIIIITGLGRVYSSLLYAEENFSLATYAPSLEPIISMAGLLTLGATFGIYTLATCMLIGIALQLMTLIWSIKKRGIPFVPKWTGFSKALNQVLLQYKPMLTGQFLIWSAKVVDRAMAAMLAPGSVAALNYGTKIISGFKGIGAMALGRAILPYLSKMVAKEDWQGVADTLKTYFIGALLVTIPISFVLILLSEPIVQIIFQRGSFNANDTVLVAQIQSMYFLQMPFYILNVLGIRLLNALKENRVLMKVSAANLIANVGFNIILMKYMGVAGIALSTSIGYLISAILIYGTLFKNFKELVPSLSRS